jgi:hypothetical protein
MTNEKRIPSPPCEDDVLRRMLNTPHKPHVAKPKARKKTAKKPPK